MTIRNDRTPEQLKRVRASQRHESMTRLVHGLEQVNVPDNPHWSLKDLEKATGLSQRTLRRETMMEIIKHQTGRTFGNGHAPQNEKIEPIKRKVEKLERLCDSKDVTIRSLRDKLKTTATNIADLQRVVDALAHKTRNKLMGDNE